MSLEIILTIFGLALVGGLTPGPNNSLVASSAATFGIRRTLPLMLGIIFGFPVVITSVGLGLGEVFQRSPLIEEILHWVGAALLLWIAWKIATSATAVEGQTKQRRPITFWQSAGFQVVNPKGWAMSIALTSQFVTGENATAISFSIGFIFMIVGVTSTTAWALFGRAIHRFLGTPARLMWFNRLMALLIIVFLIILLRTG